MSNLAVLWVFRRVSNAALANAALVLSSKNWENIQDGGRRRKINPKSLGSVFSLSCRAGIDAALVKADFFFAGVPTIENKIKQKIQNTKVASAKVAFDTVRVLTKSQGFPKHSQRGFSNASVLPHKALALAPNRNLLPKAPRFRTPGSGKQTQTERYPMGDDNFLWNLRFPAVFCENLRLQNAVIPRKSENQQKSAKNCEKLGAKNWTKTFFVLKLFGHFRDIPAKFPGYPAQKVWFPWFRGAYRTFWPPPLHVEDPYPTGKYPDSKVWVCALFSCLTQGTLPYQKYNAE